MEETREPDYWSGLAPDVREAYRHALTALNDAGERYLVGGAFAFYFLTGVPRATKDLDLFVRPADYESASRTLAAAGFETDLTFPHWLGKARLGNAPIDLIFSSGNGLAAVDDLWFKHARQGEVFGIPVGIVPPEETIWSKAFVMERERYDGADVVHLLRACGGGLDWHRLLARFGPHWRVLLAHLVLFGYVYPGERARVPPALLERLVTKLVDEGRQPPLPTKLCAGTLLSREQYLHAVEREGYEDIRSTHANTMTAADRALWTGAIAHRQPGAKADE
jgi:hypothetical protein